MDVETFRGQDLVGWSEKCRRRLQELDDLAHLRHKQALSAKKALVIDGDVTWIPDHEQRNRALDRQFRAAGVLTPPPPASTALGLAIEIDPATGVTRVVAMAGPQPVVSASPST